MGLGERAIHREMMASGEFRSFAIEKENFSI